MEFHKILIAIDKSESAEKTFVEEGKPAEVIIRIAERFGADVIVMGTHGRKGLSHLIMGSVAEDVIKNAKRPCVVIPIS